MNVLGRNSTTIEFPRTAGKEARKAGKPSARSVAIAAALSLALTASIAGGVWRLSDSEAPATIAAGISQPVPLDSDYRAPEPDVTYYLVGSQAQAKVVLGDPMWMEPDGTSANVRYHVIVLDGTIDEGLVMQGFEDVNEGRLMDGLSALRILDLR
jgi:hypothetical protein